MLYHLARNSLSVYHLTILFSRQIQIISSSENEQDKEERINKTPDLQCVSQRLPYVFAGYYMFDIVSTVIFFWTIPVLNLHRLIQVKESNNKNTESTCNLVIDGVATSSQTNNIREVCFLLMTKNMFLF